MKNNELEYVETKIKKNGPPCHMRRVQELKISEPMEARSKPREHPRQTNTKNLDNSGTSSFDEEVTYARNENNLNWLHLCTFYLLQSSRWN